VIQRVESWYAAFGEIVNGAHVASAGELVGIINGAVARVGLSVQLYLVDRSQRQLHPVDAAADPSLVIDATMAGRAFRLSQIIAVEAEGGAPPALWVPVLNGTERLGVARMTLPAPADPRDKWVREQCWVLAGLIGDLVMSKVHYSDLFHVVRRTEPLSVASELLWQLLPPQTFACPHLVVTSVMEPYDQVGGDGYDYSVDANHSHVAVFDAVGHDLAAGLTSSLALAATRNARRSGHGLAAAAALADEVIRDHGGTRFVTALLAEFDLNTGMLHYLNAGHPPPVLLRDSRMVKTLDSPIRPPLGLGHLTHVSPQIGREQLEPGDRILLYTDGVTEARNPEGAQFGLERLVDLTERHHDAGLPAPETLRRISHAVLEHQHGRLQDDATLLLLEWTTTAPPDLLPVP
jgi:hypothetical protein